MDKDNKLDAHHLLEKHGDYLYRFALKKINDRALAEDLVQDTFISAITARDSFSAHSTVRTWLTTILKNKIVDHLRRQGREISVFDLVSETNGEEVSMDDFFDKAGHWADKPNMFPNPDSALENKQFWDSFEHCISRLKPQQAEVFLAKEVHGIDNEEISVNYSISSSNIWVLMHRARILLSKCIELHWVS